MLVAMFVGLSQPALAQLIAKEGSGGQEHGGGFAYYRTSSALLDVTKTELANQILDLRDTDLQFRRRVTENGEEKSVWITFSRSKLIKIIQSTRKNYTGKASRKNPSGVDEPLIFNFGKDENGDYIEALELFFQAYMERDLEQQDYRRVKLRLLHESAHVFGLNEDEARLWSTETLARVFLRPEGAGSEIAIKANFEQRYANNDGSITYLWPSATEYTGGAAKEFSTGSSASGVCKLLGHSEGTAVALGEGAIYKAILVDSEGALQGYRFVEDYPNFSLGSDFEATRVIFMVICKGWPADVEFPETMELPSVEERSASVGYNELTHVFTIRAPYVQGQIEPNYNRKLPFSGSSPTGGICKYLGFKQAIQGSAKLEPAQSHQLLVVAKAEGFISEIVESDSKALESVTELQCQGVDPIYRAISFAQKDEGHVYGGENTIERSTKLVDTSSADYLARLAYAKKQNSGLSVDPNLTVVSISFVDCEILINFLGVDPRSGKVTYLFVSPRTVDEGGGDSEH